MVINVQGTNMQGGGGGVGGAEHQKTRIVKKSLILN